MKLKAETARKLGMIFGTPIAMALILVAIYNVKVKDSLGPVINKSPAPQDGCMITGCSGQICSDEDVVTTCEFLHEYVCYKTVGECKKQSDGKCGWTQTEDLKNCINERR